MSTPDDEPKLNDLDPLAREIGIQEKKTALFCAGDCPRY
jgi:hypothetical protein